MTRQTAVGTICGLVAWALASPTWAQVPEVVQKAEAARIAAMDKARPSVVAVFGADGGGGGSGVVISPDGYALSNFHVTKPSGDAMKCGLPDGKLYDAVIVGIDPTGDVALVKLLGRDDFPACEIGDSDKVRVGEWCFAMGNPFLLATDFQPTCTYGLVSGVHRYQYPAGSLLEYADCIQTDASINPGNSGGPLFNEQGQLIGINGRGSFEKRGRVNVGVGYAISINQIKNFLGCLKSGRIVDHATLGARVASDDRGQVVVSDILEESDAYRRGLRYDDEVVSFGGRRITTVNQFKNALGIFPKGWRVPLTYRREGKDYDVLVRLGGVHRDAELEQLVSGKPDPKKMPMPEKKPGEPAPMPEGDKPDEQKPEGQKPEEPKPGEPNPRPLPPPVALKPPAPPMPDIVKAVYEQKRGYANYFFNKQNQQRVWQAFVARGDFSALTGLWRLEGSEADNAIWFQVEEGQASLKLPVGESRINTVADLHTASDPVDSGGLLVALHLWRQLLVAGYQGFDDVYYLGTVPWPGHTKLLDVIVAATGGVEVRFMFDPTEGHLVALESYLSIEDQDPCEIAFTDHQSVDGRFVPHGMQVRYGDRLYGTYKLNSFKLAPKAPEAQP